MEILSLSGKQRFLEIRACDGNKNQFLFISAHRIVGKEEGEFNDKLHNFPRELTVVLLYLQCS